MASMLGYILLMILYFGYLEIFKNQIWGWIIVTIVAVAYRIIKNKVINNQKWYIKCTGFLLFAAILVLVALISKPVEQRVKAVKVKNMEYTQEVKVTQGSLIGVYNEDKSVEVFAGIPYAKPPVGELRWREPQEPDSWEGVKKCDYFAPMAMQSRSNPIISFGSSIVGYKEIPFSLEDNYIEAMSEDCLYLNIWRPTGTKAGDNLPVLFYVHGGSLNSGQSYWEPYNGANLAKQGIIVVNIAYRLGVFGYMADTELAKESPNNTTGNYGLLDQIQALKWVNENIGNFGGNAENITIAGESAGASSVNAMCVSPLAKGLFKRVIAESSSITAKQPYHTFRSYEEALEACKNIKEEFNCSIIDELRNVPADQLVNTQAQNNEMTVDGYAITEQPFLTYMSGNNNEEAILNGFNGDEATVFMMFNPKTTLDNYEEKLQRIADDYAGELAQAYPAADDKEAHSNFMYLMGAAWFGYSHYTWSNYTSDLGIPTYLYHFNKSNKALGPWHAGELAYFYGNIPGLNNFKNRGVITLKNTYNNTDYELSEAMQTYYLNFIKTGNPNTDGSGSESNLPTWETYNDNPDQYMLFDTNIGMADNTYLKAFKVFDKVMDGRYTD